MAEYDFYIEHKPGAKRVIPDTLSRYPTDVFSVNIPECPPADVTSFIATAIGFDIPHHTPDPVSALFSSSLLCSDPSHFCMFVPNDTDLQRLKVSIIHPLVCIEVVVLFMHVCLEISTGETWQSICTIGFVVALTVIALKLRDSHMVLCKFELMNIYSTLGTDFVSELPCSPNGNKWILTPVCPFSNYLIAIPVRDKTATTASRALFDNVFLCLVFHGN